MRMNSTYYVPRDFILFKPWSPVSHVVLNISVFSNKPGPSGISICLVTDHQSVSKNSRLSEGREVTCDEWWKLQKRLLMTIINRAWWCGCRAIKYSSLALVNGEHRKVPSTGIVYPVYTALYQDIQRRDMQTVLLLWHIVNTEAPFVFESKGFTPGGGSFRTLRGCVREKARKARRDKCSEASWRDFKLHCSHRDTGFCSILGAVPWRPERSWQWVWYWLIWLFHPT